MQFPTPNSKNRFCSNHSLEAKDYFPEIIKTNLCNKARKYPKRFLYLPSKQISQKFNFTGRKANIYRSNLNRTFNSPG